LNSMLCVRRFAMGFLLSKARLAGQFFLARLSGPRGPLQRAGERAGPNSGMPV
jgi:hypothetical protein